MFYVTGTTVSGHQVQDDRVFITEKEVSDAVDSAIKFGIIVYAEVHSVDSGEVIFTREAKRDEQV